MVAPIVKGWTAAGAVPVVPSVAELRSIGKGKAAKIKHILIGQGAQAGLYSWNASDFSGTDFVEVATGFKSEGATIRTLPGCTVSGSVFTFSGTGQLIPGHGLIDGQAVILTAISGITGVSLGSSNNQFYYVRRINATTFRLATTPENAFAGTTISISGTGTATVVAVFDSVGGYYTFPNDAMPDGSEGGWVYHNPLAGVRADRYGAVPDGATDARAAIQHALNSLRNVYLSQGEYIASLLRLRKPQAINASGNRLIGVGSGHGNVNGGTRLSANAAGAFLVSFQSLGADMCQAAGIVGMDLFGWGQVDKVVELCDTTTGTGIWHGFLDDVVINGGAWTGSAWVTHGTGIYGGANGTHYANDCGFRRVCILNCAVACDMLGAMFTFYGRSLIAHNDIGIKTQSSSAWALNDIVMSQNGLDIENNNAQLITAFGGWFEDSTSGLAEFHAVGGILDTVMSLNGCLLHTQNATKLVDAAGCQGSISLPGCRISATSASTKITNLNANFTLNVLGTPSITPDYGDGLTRVAVVRNTKPFLSLVDVTSGSGAESGLLFGLGGTENKGHIFVTDNGTIQYMQLGATAASSQVWLTAGGAVPVKMSATQALILAGSSSVPSLAFQVDGDLGLYRIGADILGVAANGAEVARFSANGISLDGGLNWLASQTRTAFGTAPTITIGGNTGTTYSKNVGFYSRILDRVKAQIRINVNALSGSGAVLIKNLPVAARNIADNYEFFKCEIEGGASGGNANGSKEVWCYTTPGSTDLTLFAIVSGVNTAIVGTDLANGCWINCDIEYFV